MLYEVITEILPLGISTLFEVVGIGDGDDHPRHPSPGVHFPQRPDNPPFPGKNPVAHGQLHLRLRTVSVGTPSGDRYPLHLIQREGDNDLV